METDDREDAAVTTWTVADTKGLTVQGERKAGTLIAKTAGRVDGSNASDFQGALEIILKEDLTALLLDLGDVSYISSAGLRVILVVAKQLQSRSVKFGVCSLSESINEVFEISGFNQIIPTYAAQADALSVLSE